MQVTPTPAAQPSTAKQEPLAPGDHEAWVSRRPADLRPGDHVLIIQAARPQTPPSQQTPAAQAQPAAAATPRGPGSSAIAAQAPAPQATPKLSPIDHVLLVSVHPGIPGASADHALKADSTTASGWTPGRQLLASLDLPPGHHLTEGEELLMRTADDSYADPMNWSVLVHKSSYELEVFYKGKHFDSFPAVFGRNPDHAAKLWEGDLRTPEGNYLIVEKYYTPRWRWFLRLNYPNYSDRTRYENMREQGLVPVLHGHSRALGGAIGIHGTDRPRFNRLHINWTLGCISVDNGAIEELQRLLPLGTLVIIKQ